MRLATSLVCFCILVRRVVRGEEAWEKLPHEGSTCRDAPADDAEGGLDAEDNVERCAVPYVSISAALNYLQNPDA